MKRYFITGTDTDCGKTYVTAKLVQHYPNTTAIKPVASGGSIIDNQFQSYDSQYLQPYSKLPIDTINPWPFKLPVSPHIAAKEEGCTLSINEIADYCLNLNLKNTDRLFIEGAGGLMAPLTMNQNWIDFLKHTKIPCILVVGLKLGCINHALLTQTALKTNNINCAGWIANCIDPNMLALKENMETLTHLLAPPLLATIPYASEKIMDVNLDLL